MNGARKEARKQRAGKDREIYVSRAPRGFAARLRVLSQLDLLAAHNVELVRRLVCEQAFHSDNVLKKCYCAFTMKGRAALFK